MIKVFVIVAAAGLLAGCASNRPASIYQGECRVFSDPGFRVRGRELRDDRWISQTQEQGISVCGWKRPLPTSRAAVNCTQVREVVATYGREQTLRVALQSGMTPRERAQAEACLVAKPMRVRASQVPLRRVSETVYAAPTADPVAAPMTVQPKKVAAPPSKVAPKPARKVRQHFWQIWRPKA